MSTGFDGLLSVHIEALKQNSDEILDILEYLNNNTRKLSGSELSSLKSINKSIKKLDDSIEKILDEDNDGF